MAKYRSKPNWKIPVRLSIYLLFEVDDKPNNVVGILRGISNTIPLITLPQNYLFLIIWLGTDIEQQLNTKHNVDFFRLVWIYIFSYSYFAFNINVGLI